MGISFERVSVMNAFANWDDINIKSPEKTKIRFKSLYIVDNIEEPVNVKKDPSGNVIINMKDVMKVFARAERNPKLLTETEKELYKSVLRGKWEVL